MARLLLALAALLLTACAGTDSRVDSASWAEHSARLRAASHWIASGKVAERNSELQEAASMEWRQRGRHSDVLLSGPLGVGATRLSSDGRQLEIRRDGERRVVDISTPHAIVANIGWNLPLQALPHWLRGLPAPASRAAALELDPATGLLRSLQQNGWRVQYEDYRPFDDLLLPTRLRIDNGDTRARIMIRRWRGVEPE